MNDKTSIQTVTGPTLNGSGAFNVTFGEFEKVTDAVVYFDNPFKTNKLFHAKTSLATNVVTVTIEKEDHGGGAWAVAVSPGGTGDMVGKKVSVLAHGE